MATTMTIKVKAFSGEGVRINRVQIDGDVVRVWDSVAGHYTTMHAMSARTVRRILAAAK
jgi:hypothetical protein